MKTKNKKRRMKEHRCKYGNYIQFRTYIRKCLKLITFYDIIKEKKNVRSGRGNADTGRIKCPGKT